MGRWLPPNVSTYGGEIDRLFFLIYYITGGVFILVALTMIAFLVMYRDRGDGRRATYSHGNNTLEVIWTVIPTIIFLALALMGTKSWADIKINPPPPDLTIRVLAKQFNWIFTYPGPDGVFDTKDDFKSENKLRVPVHKKVHVLLSAEDVIHSFYVPQFRLKQDALPGRIITAWFEATAAGTYEIPCAELCGLGHTTMLGRLVVMPDDVAQWKNDAGEWKDEQDVKAVRRGWPSTLLPAAAAATPTPAPSPTPEASPSASTSPAASPGSLPATSPAHK